MKLYEFAPTRSIRVRWTLQELGVDFESVTVDLLAGEHRRPEFLEINPAGKIPVLVDDWALQTGRQGYAEWRRELRALVDRLPVVVLGLHDCYARHWLPDYPDLLAELRAAGDLVTCEEIAERAFLASDFA